MVEITRVAVIDIGTNSTRLLVAGVDGQGRVTPLHTDLITTRLGQGIGSGMLQPEAVSRTLEAVLDMQSQAGEKQAQIVVAAATSAVRDAGNRDWFLEEVQRATGIAVRVLEGKEEALLSYRGVSAGTGVDLDSAVIVDIGGGSTEFTWSRGARVNCRSLNVGAVRMTEGRHDEWAIRELLGETLDEVRQQRLQGLIGVGGTVTTLAAMDLKLEKYDRRLVHGHRLDLAAVRRLLVRLVEAGPEGRKNMAGLQPARADIIVAGVRILLAVMEGLDFEHIRVSEADLMYGLALDAVKPVETKKGI